MAVSASFSAFQISPRPVVGKSHDRRKSGAMNRAGTAAGRSNAGVKLTFFERLFQIWKEGSCRSRRRRGKMEGEGSCDVKRRRLKPELQRWGIRRRVHVRRDPRAVRGNAGFR